MPQPNGLSINSAPLDESEDVEPLIQSDAGVCVCVCVCGIFVAGKRVLINIWGFANAAKLSRKVQTSFNSICL